MKQQMDLKKYELDVEKFKLQLSPLGLKVKEIQGDGNCMFRAIADQLEGDQAMHSMYRQAAVEYILSNKEDFVPFIEDDETIQEYCKDMASDGVWGGQLEMNALATEFKFNLIVHQVDNPSMA